LAPFPLFFFYYAIESYTEVLGSTPIKQKGSNMKVI